MWCMYDDEAQQVCQKILRCLDMRVMDGDLIMPTCLLMPTLILPTGHFIQMYYDLDAQGQYASHFPTRGQGFLQPMGDIRASIVPRDFRVLPANVREVIDLYFRREELEARVNLEEDEYMSTDTEAANTVLYLDEEYLELAERVVQWQTACRGTASAPPWWLSDFSRPEQSYFDKLPDLRDLLNQGKEARVLGHIPMQSVALMPLPFASVRDLDCQCQQCHDQTMAKWQASPLDGKHRKWAKMPPQPEPYNAPDSRRTQAEQCESRDRGCSRTRGECQAGLDEVRSKSRAWSKSQRRSKSQRWNKSRKHRKSKKRSKSRRCDEGRERGRHEPHRPGVWPSQYEREVPNWSPSNTAQKDGRCARHPAPSNDLSKFLKLKDEIVKHAQSYIRGHAMVICRTLTPDHEAVKCLLAFGGQAQKFAAEILATIEWGTQHWKLQEPFPVHLVPKWLRTPKFTQTTKPPRGELPLIPTGAHFEDIHVCCPAVWSWMAVLLQYWQDHMTRHLYRGRFCQISDLAATLIWDINPWLPHKSLFRWGYVAMHATLWIDQWDLFAQEHLEEWKYKRPGHALSATSSRTQKWSTGPASSRGRKIKPSLIVRRQLHRSCHLNDSSRLAQKGRPVPRLERKMWVRQAWVPPSTPTGLWVGMSSAWALTCPGRTECLERVLMDASHRKRNWMWPRCSTLCSRARELKDPGCRHTTVKHQPTSCLST